eukprot:XP_011676975.1 PREDICTED: uncharacterized protein LOC100890150 isoform X1 [Strongylocentrotus purpuratus]
MVKDARLRERSFGEGEGLSREERASKGSFDPEGAETRKQCINHRTCLLGCLRVQSARNYVRTATLHSEVVDRGLSFLHDLCLDVHKAYGHRMDDCREIMTGSSPVEEEEEGEIGEDDSFEVVFAVDNNDASTGDACSSDITQNSTHGTVVSQRETCVAIKTQKQVSGTKHATNTTGGTSKEYDQDSQHGTTSEPTRGTTTLGSTGKLGRHPIFKSDITGINDTPPNCPHIFVSAHGYILRALFQTLQKQYKMIDFAGGKSILKAILRGRCPNTGLSTFVFTLDSDGLLSDVECFFVYAIDHLEGIEYIHT